MGLSNSSTGKKVSINSKNFSNYDFTVAIAGNPNVGKSTIFNGLTGLNQHTGNWTGKTVENSAGICVHNNQKFLLVDIPGTYSLMADSEEEKIARDFINSNKANVTVVIVDATLLERNLNLVFQIMNLTNNVIVCVNLLDEARKKGITVDLSKLSELLAVPVVGTIARKKNTLSNLINTISDVCNHKIQPNPITISANADKFETTSPINLENSRIQEKIFLDKVFEKAHEIVSEVITVKNENYNERDKKIDKILTSKKFGIPIMILFFCLIFWITIVGANYPSELLSSLFANIEQPIKNFFVYIHTPDWLLSLVFDGIYKTVTWIVSVMFPPMAIFFPLFTLLEDLGYLPRIAFNLDKCFKKCRSSGKQALTMCMGFGCNAAGVVGCRIISSKRERLIAIITNNFVPCNGRFPFLITISTIFFAGIANAGKSLKSSLIATFIVFIIICIGISFTFLVSYILSKTILKGSTDCALLELPPYRKPQIGKILLRSLLDRTLFVLGRALSVAIPAGILIWVLSNVQIANISILAHISAFFDPFAKLMGLDGYIFTAFLLGLPANEIVLPIILMCYTGSGSLVDMSNIQSLFEILSANGWTIVTAINVMLFSLLHFPCATTLLTIKNETKSWEWTAIAFLIPTVIGIVMCMLVNLIYNVIHFFI